MPVSILGRSASDEIPGDPTAAESPLVAAGQTQ